MLVPVWSQPSTDGLWFVLTLNRHLLHMQDETKRRLQEYKSKYPVRRPMHEAGADTVDAAGTAAAVVRQKNILKSQVTHLFLRDNFILDAYFVDVSKAYDKDSK